MKSHPTADQGRRWRRLPRFLLKGAVSAGILILLFRFIPTQDLWAALLQADPLWVALAYAFVGLQFVFLSLQFQKATGVQGIRHTLWATWRIQVIATFYGVILPSELTSSVVKIYRLSKRGKHLAQAAASVIYCRLLNTMTGILMAIPALYFEPRMKGNALNTVTVAAGVGLLLLFMPFVSQRTARIVETRVGIQVGRLPLPRVVRSKGGKLWSAVTRMNGMPGRTLAAMIALSVLFNLMAALILCALAAALDLPVGLLTSLWLVTAVYVVMMLPISIAGLGVREVTFVGVLTNLYGIDAALAVALSFLFLGARLVAAFAGAILEALALLRSGKPLRQR